MQSWCWQDCKWGSTVIFYDINTPCSDSDIWKSCITSRCSASALHCFLCSWLKTTCISRLRCIITRLLDICKTLGNCVSFHSALALDLLDHPHHQAGRNLRQYTLDRPDQTLFLIWKAKRTHCRPAALNAPPQCVSQLGSQPCSQSLLMH